MTKIDLIKEVSDASKLPQKEVDAVLSSYAGIVVDVLSENATEKIPLPGIGAFTVKAVPVKEGVIQFGETKGKTWTKPAHNELKFSISKNTKEI